LEHSWTSPEAVVHVLRQAVVRCAARGLVRQQDLGLILDCLCDPNQFLQYRCTTMYEEDLPLWLQSDSMLSQDNGTVRADNELLVPRIMAHCGAAHSLVLADVRRCGTLENLDEALRTMCYKNHQTTSSTPARVVQAWCNNDGMVGLESETNTLSPLRQTRNEHGSERVGAPMCGKFERIAAHASHHRVTGWRPLGRRPGR